MFSFDMSATGAVYLPHEGLNPGVPLGVRWTRPNDDDELMLNVLRCHLTY